MSDDDKQYLTNLAEYVDKTIRSWAQNKRDYLDQKFTNNFEAVTNRDFRVKRWKKEEGEGWRSTTWIGFIRVKVWAFYALFTDTVLKAGKIPFTLEPSPYDDETKDERMVQDRDERIERMTDKIQEQLKLRKADREYMRKWLSLGYYGMAFSKFNIEAIKNTEFREIEMDMGPAAQYLQPEELEQYRRFEMVNEDIDVPGHRYVSVWNMVWDQEADGLQPEDGSRGYAERIPSSAYDLNRLKGKPGYLDDMIKKVVDKKTKEDSSSEADDMADNPAKVRLNDRKQKFKRFEYYMLAPRVLVDEFEKNMRSKQHADGIYRLGLIEDYEEAEESGDDVEIMGEIVDGEIIRHIRNETGKRLHHLSVLERNLDESTGTGIADNMEDVQSWLVGMIRSFEDNKKLSANVTTAVKERFFKNPDQLKDIVPGKQFDITDSCDDVRKAIMPIIFPDVGESLMSGIELGLKLKDDVSMIPTIMQGFTLQKHQPDTAYEMRQLTENAGKYIGQAIRNNDEMFIEPEIRDLYEYNMLFGDDESCKVNAKVVPNGFTSFQNKEIRGERMKQALGLMMASEFLMPHVKVKPHLDVIYESMDEDPDKFIASEEELAQKQQQDAEAQAMAEAKAMRMMQIEKGIETQAKQAEETLKHQHELEKGEQEHKHTILEKEKEHIDKMEEITLEDKLDDDDKNPKQSKEGQNDSR